MLTSCPLLQLQILTDKCQQLSLKETMERQRRIKEAERAKRAEEAGAEGVEDEMDGVEGVGADAEGADSDVEEDALPPNEADMEDMFSVRPTALQRKRAPLKAAAAGGEGAAPTGAMSPASGRAGKENKVAGRAFDAKTVAAAQAAAAEAAAAVPAGPKPKMHEDYAGWLQHQKGRWRQARGERKRRRADAQREMQRAGRAGAGGVGGGQEGGTPGGALGPDRADVGALLRHRAAAVTAVTWQLLQLAETPTPGRFKVQASSCIIIGRRGLRGLPSLPWTLTWQPILSSWS